MHTLSILIRHYTLVEGKNFKLEDCTSCIPKDPAVSVFLAWRLQGFASTLGSLDSRDQAQTLMPTHKQFILRALSPDLSIMS
jgi:hypothetical protein